MATTTLAETTTTTTTSLLLRFVIFRKFPFHIKNSQKLMLKLAICHRDSIAEPAGHIAAYNPRNPLPCSPGKAINISQTFMRDAQYFNMFSSIYFCDLFGLKLALIIANHLRRQKREGERV